jgi:hypothetical protein
VAAALQLVDGGRRIEVELDQVEELVHQQRIGGRLELLSARCGCNRNAFQTRPVVEADRAGLLGIDPATTGWRRPANSRMATTCSIWASLIVRGHPARSLSYSPSSRPIGHEPGGPLAHCAQLHPDRTTFD